MRLMTQPLDDRFVNTATETSRTLPLLLECGRQLARQVKTILPPCKSTIEIKPGDIVQATDLRKKEVNVVCRRKSFLVRRPELRILIMKVVNGIEYPFEYDELNPEETEELLNFFKREIFTKYIRLGPNGHFFYKEFGSVAVDVYNMPLKPNDIFLVSFPRSGTTWSQELVWLLKNNLDYETAKTVNLVTRFPFIESAGFLNLNFPKDTLEFKKVVFPLDPEDISKLPEPRFIKTHMPLSLLPPSLLDKTKVVYVARNPLDVVVSNFFHMKSTEVLPKDREFKPYWNLFMQSKTLWTPFFSHVKEAWIQRNHPNMIFLFYEELSKDLPTTARRLAKFLGVNYTDEQYEKLCDHLNFGNFKNNGAVLIQLRKETGDKGDSFVRNGKSGGWRDHFDAEMTRQAESWIADNLRDTDLRFPPS